MNADEEIVFQQYKLYTEQKERFIERSFKTNKFYLLLVLVLIIVMFLTNDYTFAFGLSSTFIFGTAGLAVCSLWWLNMDSYNVLIKIKLSKVIEEMEKNLPAQPFNTEHQAIKDFKKNKKEFLFSDMQKALAILALLLFSVLVANEIVHMVFG